MASLIELRFEVRVIGYIHVSVAVEVERFAIGKQPLNGERRPEVRDIGARFSYRILKKGRNCCRAYEFDSRAGIHDASSLSAPSYSLGGVR